MVFIWCFLPSFSSPYKVRNSQLLLGLPDLTIMFWSMPGTGLLVQKSWLTQIPHRYLTGHNGLYLASSIITLMFFSLSRLNTVQNNKDTKKRKCTHTHTLSLSLSLSLTFSWRPARSPDKTAPCKLQPHHHKSMFLEETCSVLLCASVHVSCENLFIPVFDWYRCLDIPVWSLYWISF
jgi:hypothetical protein